MDPSVFAPPIPPPPMMRPGVTFSYIPPPVYMPPSPAILPGAWGQENLDGGVAVAEAPYGEGRVVLCGPQILFRGQPHGTYKFLFNAISQAKPK